VATATLAIRRYESEVPLFLSMALRVSVSCRLLNFVTDFHSPWSDGFIAPIVYRTRFRFVEGVPDLRIERPSFAGGLDHHGERATRKPVEVAKSGEVSS
jgi:hypothetical protein